MRSRILQQMVKLKKFKGFIPPKEVAPKLIAPPYDVVNTKEAREIAGDNEMNFLHVNRPDIEFPDGTDLYSQQVYDRARDNLKKFIDKGYLIQDKAARVYIYAQKMGSHIQYGIVALSHVDDYEKGIIKKHEFTRKDKEADRTKFTDIQNANVGPVFLTYKHKDTINSVVKEIVSTQECYSHVVSEDGFEHTLWLVDEFYSDFLVHEFGTISNTYIADGHHRAASAFNVGKLRKEKALAEGKKLTGEEDFHYFMTILYPDNNLKVLDYNRVLKEFNGNTEAQVMEKIGKAYEISPIEGDPRPKAKGFHSLYIGKKWYQLKVKAGIVDEKDSIKSLDVEVLMDNVLKPIFGIEDPRTDKRIDFVGGIRGLKELEKRCDEDCVCAFAMYPVSITEIMNVADSGKTMPPKSTWFEPKPKSGFVVHVIEDN
jgi:uncharacterized protein (DUF1015 family)